MLETGEKSSHCGAIIQKVSEIVLDYFLLHVSLADSETCGPQANQKLALGGKSSLKEQK